MSTNKKGLFMKPKDGAFHRFFDELLLNSGQYALFYILMNFSYDGIFYFKDVDHTTLFLFLAIQTFILSKHGHIIKVRFWGSLLVPFCYSLFESKEGLAFVLNAGHFSFWIFSIITATLQCFSLMSVQTSLKKKFDYSLTIINVFIFVYLYFYFDIKLDLLKKMEAGAINFNQYTDSLQIQNIVTSVLDLFTDPAHIYLLIGSIFLSVSLAEGRNKITDLKDQINELLGIYVGKSTRDEIIHKKSKRKSEAKNIAIVFSDIRNFTALSENANPSDVVSVLNYYFDEWYKTVTKRNGKVDKFIGDAIMNIFDSKDEESSCNDAVDSSIEMFSKLNDLNAFLKAQKLPELKRIGVGINFGTSILGDIGSHERLNYTVIGDPVNVASRIESLCKVYDRNLIISDYVYNKINESNKSKFDYLGEAALKGKEEKIKIWGIKKAS